MPDAQIPDRPSLEQYKKQAKDLLRACVDRNPAALERIHQHPRFRNLTPGQVSDQLSTLVLADAQLVLAREHGFPSWPQFAAELEKLRIIRSVEEIHDPVATFIEVASVPRHGWHASGSLEHAELILARYPHVATASIYAAAILADEAAVRAFLARDPELATAPGGPYPWDALTYLCFSRYLRLDKNRSDDFVRAARALLAAGANPNTGWTEYIDDPPRPTRETVIYAAAGLAQHPGLTRLLLDYGADPNDEETPYHVPETYDNTVMQIILDSGRFNQRALACLAVRKADWHDEKGLALALAAGADPNYSTMWKVTPFHHSIQRDNGLVMIEMFLDHGADPSLRNSRDHRNAFQMAAYHGRGDILSAFEKRGFVPNYDGPDPELDQLVSACALADRTRVQSILTANPQLLPRLLQMGGSLLARFSGAANLEGVRTLLSLGVPAGTPWPEGDPYFDTPHNSTALHYAAWRAHHDIVRELIAHGAPVNAIDMRGRTPLQLAVKACIDSYWQRRRQPDSVAALLAAGATKEGIKLPTGYDAIDAWLLSS
ncbi:MAG TPA: ankyrin repeat domain-containing protein [Acidobacteriaceae bacterium]|nr:ankyrin repeat domain-containing protein [Acidobacteriaceae bacterium]